MKIVHTISSLQSELKAMSNSDRNIGFVPTMGALHAGHAELVRKCYTDGNLTVVSVFVNPTQFNDKSDLDKYPRTLEADCKLLEECGTDIVFAPSVEEMYPQEDTRSFSYPPLDTVMEGYFRPGHFNGVCQIVSKLFDAVKPNKAYFGEKDYQQLAIIKMMVEKENYDIEIVPCPIVREPDGLAMSSRNTRLDERERKEALLIYKTLKESLERVKDSKVEEVRQFVESEISKSNILKLEYFDIVDSNTLQSINKWEDTKSAVGCIAAFCGDTRLIDNITYTK